MGGVVHCPGMLHCTHVPEKHTPCAHCVLSAFGGLDGEPIVQMSLVHSSASTGRSPLFATIFSLPPPSHCRSLQSPTFCCAGGNGVLFGVKLYPHTLLTHVRVLQKSSTPGQSVGIRQPTQLPLP